MSKGRFGVHGGQYMPETLMNAVIELEEAYNHYKNDPEFNAELTELLNNYAGRPSRLYFAEHMTNDLGGAKIYLKREDLNHTGAHKINNVLGQALLAKKMGKTRLIAETGAGQHGVATATAAALMGMECVVFMGVEDTERAGAQGVPYAPARRGGHPGFDRHGARSRMPARQPSASGLPALTIRITASAHAWARTRSRPSCAISSRSSPRRSRSRCSKKRAGCRMS